MRSPEKFPGQNNNAKSYKRAGKPCAPETNAEKGEGLPRPPLKTFSLRQRCGHEGAVLGLSRSQNSQAHISLSWDPTSQRRRTRERHESRLAEEIKLPVSDWTAKFSPTSRSPTKSHSNRLLIKRRARWKTKRNRKRRRRDS